jgi:2-methylisocitrate lyase-like PEP mutase family enzyme
VPAASLRFPALATTSAGVAWALGYPDGDCMSRREMLGTIERITARVAAPVSADMERGYGNTPDEAAETVRRTLGAGAVGINLEDGVDHATGALPGMPAGVGVAPVDVIAEDSDPLSERIGAPARRARASDMPSGPR